MEFNALVVDKDEEKNITSSQVKKIDVSQLPEGDVLVNVCLLYTSPSPRD